MARIAMLVSVAFFVGLGLGFLLGAHSRGEKRAPEGRWAAEVTREAVPAGQGEALEAAAHEAAKEPDAAKPSASTGDLMERAIASIPEAPVERGEGAIGGTVKTEAGEPLPGVLVRAQLAAQFAGASRETDGALPAEKPLGQQVAEFVADRRWQIAQRTESTTDAQGVFSLARLAEGEHDIMVFRKGYRFHAAGEPKNRSVRARPGDAIAFVGTPIAAVRFAVLMPDGGQAREAQIQCETGEAKGADRSNNQWTPGDPVVWLAPGRWTAKATIDDLASAPVEIAVEAGANEQKAILQLAGRPGIRGRVIFPPGGESDKVCVYLLKGDGGNPPTPESLGASGKQSLVRGGGDRTFSYMDLSPGTYFLGASYGRGKVVVMEAVDVGEATLTIDIALPPLDPADFVLVRVFGPKGEVVTDVEFETGFRSENWRSSGGSTVSRSADGSFRVMHHENERVGDDTNGKYWIKAKSKTYGPWEVEYIRGETAEIRIDYTDPATLEVAIPNYAGSGYEGFLDVQLQEAGTRPARGPMRRPGKNKEPIEGKIALGPVSPGEYSIVLSFELERFSSLPFLVVPVTLVPGANQKTVTLPGLHSLTIVFDDPKSAQRVLLMAASQGKRALFGPGKRPDEAGKIVFDKVPAGQYRVMVMGAGGIKQMEVTVPAPGEVRFQSE